MLNRAKSDTQIRTASPTLKQLFLVMREKELTLVDMGVAVGTSGNVIQQYRSGSHSPSIMRVEEMAEALGLELVLLPKSRK